MPLCVIVQPIHAVAGALLRQHGIDLCEGHGLSAGELAAAVVRAEAAITRNGGLAPEVLAAAERLRIIAVHGAGTDALPMDLVTRLGIVVANTPDANARSVAEHAWSLLLAVAKRVPAADAAARCCDFDFKYRARSREIYGATLGLVGFGRIARLVCRYAQAFGLNVIALSPNQPDEVFRTAGAGRARDLHELLARAGIVSLHLPLNTATRHLIDAGALARMPSDAILINTSRGAVVDEAALARWLADHPDAGAGLDVFAQEPPPIDHALLALPNVVLSPHSAASSEAALRRMALEAAEAVVATLAGGRPRHVVNPTVLDHSHRQGSAS